MRDVQLVKTAIADMQFWLANDRKTLDKIYRLLLEAKRAPFEGIGKPEALRSDKSGLWSRRITDEHRMIYEVTDKFIIVHSLRGHYED
jgi:toxin YoeB